MWITSRIGRVKAQVKLMEGVNPDTVWTWNAIGKRAGAWGLAPEAPEATRGFLLNHLIAELLPEQAGGYRYSNSDPVTGQAAWYDLRCAIEKAAAQERRETSPRFEPLRIPLGVGTGSASGRCASAGQVAPHQPAAKSGTGTAGVSNDRTPRHHGKKLGLVIDLDTCVGCQACATCCKEWNNGGYSAPLTDQEPYGADPHGAWLNRVHGYEVGEGARRPHRAFPALLPALRGAGLRHRVPHRCLLQARRGRHRAGRSRHLHRLQAVLVGLPVRRARVRLRRRHHEEMHAVRRPHL